MKTLFALLTVLVASASAQAANSSITYDFRADAQSVDYNDAAATADSSRYYLKTGRLYFKGNLNERFKYDLRWTFNKPAVESVNTATGAPANTKRDALNSSVEYASITDKMTDWFSLTVGKFGTEIGGFEGATSGADLYMVSPLYQHAAVGDLNGRNIAINGNLLYMTGAKGLFTVAEGHNVYVVAANNASDSVDAGTKFNQNRGLLGVAWKGEYMEKALTGLVSYHTVSPQSATGSDKDKHDFISVGVKYDADWVGSLEYNTAAYNDGATSTKDTLTAVIAKFGYKFDQWTPRVEVFSSQEDIKIGTATKNTFTGVGLVAEYKPTADNVRYHVAYNSITAKPETGDQKAKAEFLVGARLAGDFLK